MNDENKHGNRHEILDPEAFPDFVIRDRREILHLCKAMLDKRTLMSAYIDHDTSFVTAVLGISDDEQTLTLDTSPDASLNERAANASELVCVTRLDGVRLQFTVATPARAVDQGLAALHVPLPASVLRLQRREFYRQTVPMANAVSCVIVITNEAGEHRSIPIRVLDISNGGIAVLVPPKSIEFEPGQEFENCVVSIPEQAPVTVKLRVRNLFHVSSRAGHPTLRAGCEFYDMPRKFMAQVQRYIFQIERDRRTLEPNH
ncbi:MAG: flagellar brake protein [Rhodocyclales bacterium]|nr:flagellar brake protein [Rhodocyclales bacterium]